VLSPDVNESFVEFAVVPDPKNPDNRFADVRFGMNAIKNVGTGAVEEILRARAENGHFETLEEFLSSVNPRVVNRKAMESLIKAGAFDRYGDRSKLLHNLDMMLAFAQRLQKEANSGQVDIFGNSEDVVVERAKLELQPAVEQYDNHEQLLWERELLGLYLSQHPLELFEAYLDEQCTPALAARSLMSEKSQQKMAKKWPLLSLKTKPVKSNSSCSRMPCKRRLGCGNVTVSCWFAARLMLKTARATLAKRSRLPSMMLVK
jgi:DNA polymerase III alpha subunit